MLRSDTVFRSRRGEASGRTARSHSPHAERRPECCSGRFRRLPAAGGRAAFSRFPAARRSYLGPMRGGSGTPRCPPPGALEADLSIGASMAARLAGLVGRNPSAGFSATAPAGVCEQNTDVVWTSGSVRESLPALWALSQLQAARVEPARIWLSLPIRGGANWRALAWHPAEEIPKMLARARLAGGRYAQSARLWRAWCATSPRQLVRRSSQTRPPLDIRPYAGLLPTVREDDNRVLRLSRVDALLLGSFSTMKWSPAARIAQRRPQATVEGPHMDPWRPVRSRPLARVVDAAAGASFGSAARAGWSGRLGRRCLSIDGFRRVAAPARNEWAGRDASSPRRWPRLRVGDQHLGSRDARAELAPCALEQGARARTAPCRPALTSYDEVINALKSCP
jgi:hypothetical protein